MKGLRAALLSAAIVLALPCAAAQAQEQWYWTFMESELGPGSESITSDRWSMDDEDWTFQRHCTAGFVLTDGVEHYATQRAACSFGSDGLTAPPAAGCGPLPAQRGSHVEYVPRYRPHGPHTWQGTVVYNSWSEMERNGETDPEACAHNDFALVRIDLIGDGWTPSLGGWGGPVGMTSTVDAWSDYYTYHYDAEDRRGKVRGPAGDRWVYETRLLDTVGGPHLDSHGRAFGYGGGDGRIISLSRALQYMKEHTDGFDDVRLVDGVDAFDGSGPGTTTVDQWTRAVPRP